MDGLKNFLQLISDNWTTIVAIAGLAYAIYLKAKKTYTDWIAKTEEEKQAELDKQIEIAKKLLGEIILSLVARAEISYKEEGTGLGQIKRAEVIETIFDMLPVLSYVTDQEELLAYIDELIDKALVIVREKIRAETGAEQE